MSVAGPLPTRTLAKALAYSLVCWGSVRIIVDPKQCEASLLCIGIAPDLSELPDDSDVVVVTRPVVPGDELAVRDVFLFCAKPALSKKPKQALSKKEDT
jgi:ferredoxin